VARETLEVDWPRTRLLAFHERHYGVGPAETPNRSSLQPNE
jgi:hypothetical protein